MKPRQLKAADAAAVAAARVKPNTSPAGPFPSWSVSQLALFHAEFSQPCCSCFRASPARNCYPNHAAKREDITGPYKSAISAHLKKNAHAPPSRAMLRICSAAMRRSASIACIRRMTTIAKNRCMPASISSSGVSIAGSMDTPPLRSRLAGW